MSVISLDEHDDDGDAGASGAHPARKRPPLLVAPSLTAASVPFNTVEPGLFTVACWRMDDVRFDFDSSFIVPAAKKEIAALAQIVAAHPGRPLSVFGHADPSGKDEYNKALSGRRAQAVYGMLVRDVDLWEQLYSQPFQGDVWGEAQIAKILGALVHPATGEVYTVAAPGPGSHATHAIKLFQGDHGLKPDGDAGPATRRVLFLEYQNHLCNGADLRLSPTDFLGGGGPGGKGDYQGCSELNPVLVFSKAEQKRLDALAHHTERDGRNAANRRVLVFLFRKGTRVDGGSWPCPTVSEDSSACKKRFWSDGEARRSPGSVERHYEDTRDTFACRFYDRLAMRSPCEGTGQMVLFRIRVSDHERHLIPDAPVRLVHRERTWETRADQHGAVVIRALKQPGLVRLEWTRPEWEDKGGYPFIRMIHADVSDDDEGDRRRLFNLGYSKADVHENVRDYQQDFGHDPATGQLDDIRDELRQFHDGGARPGGGEPAPAGDT